MVGRLACGYGHRLLDLASWSGVLAPRMVDDLPFVGSVLRLRRQGEGAERLGGSAIDQELDIDVVVGEVDEIGFSEGGIKLLGQKLGVFDSYPERNEGSGVSQDGCPELLVELH